MAVSKKTSRRPGDPIPVLLAGLLAACLCLHSPLLIAADPPDRPRAHVTELLPRRDPAVRRAQGPEQIRPSLPPVVPGGAPGMQPPGDSATDAGIPGLGPDTFRLPLLEGKPPLGATPRPSPEKQAEYAQFVDQMIDPENTLDLVLHRPRLLIFKQAPLRVQIADPAVADYVLITDREFSITGEKVGITMLNFWFRDPQTQREKVLSYLIRVRPSPEGKVRLDQVYKALEDEINRASPNSAVKLAMVGDKLVIQGEAKDVVEAAQILQIVGANAPGSGGAYGGGGGRGGGASQALYGELTDGPAPMQNQQMFGFPQDYVESQQSMAENTVANQVLRINSRVINLLRVAGEQQVMLRVSVAEVNRNALRTIGLNLTIKSGSGLDVFQQLAGAATIGTGNLPILLDNGQVGLALNALRSLQLARSLAEPTLVTTNGQSAAFFAGGEFPVPAATATFGAVGQGVTFIPFGVQVAFTPVITDHDRIRLQVRARVSTRDAALSATVSGTSVPGLDARTFSTTVELRDGQTLAVAGLIQNNFGSNSDRVPFFGDLPFLGTFAGSRSTTSAEQELVIIVTPELIHPLEACQSPPLPGADVFEPGDIEFFLYGRLESLRNYDHRASARTDWDRMAVYERCEEQLIIGQQGRIYGCCPNCGPNGLATGPALRPRPAPVAAPAPSPGPLLQPIPGPENPGPQVIAPPPPPTGAPGPWDGPLPRP